MKLNHILLENIGPHVRFEQEFGPGLIGVIGSQGAGKTTFTNGFFAALTNDFKRLADTKEQVIRQQAAPKDVSQIVVGAEHGGTAFTLTRQLGPSVKSRLELPGREPLTRASQVEAELQKLLGASRQMLDSHVFVDQWKLRELLHQDPKDRSKTLSHLCGTTFIEKLFELLGEQLTADMALKQQISVLDVDQLRRELGEFQTTQRTQARLVEQLTSEILDDKTAQALQQSLDDTVKAGNLSSGLDAKYQRLKELEETRSYANDELAELKARLDEAEAEAATAKTKLDRCSQELTSFDEAQVRYQQHLRRIAQRDAAQQGLAKTPPEDPRIAQPLSEIKLKLEQLETDIANETSAKAALEAIIESPTTCQTCGQPLPNVAEHVAEAQRKLATRLNELENLRSQQRQYKRTRDVLVGYHNDLKEYNHEIERHRKRLAELEQEFQLAGEVTPPAGSREELRTREADAKTQHDAAKKALKASRDDYEGAVSNHARAVAQWQSLTAAITEDEAKLEAIDALSEPEYAEVKQLLDQDGEKRTQRTAAAAVRAEYDKLIQDKQAAIARAELLRSRGEQFDAWLAALARTRAVLHRDQLPRRVHQRALQHMEGGINRMLAQFESPFRVSTSEDLSYLCAFRNGTVVEDKRLSGGQQVVLMLNFRWVLNSIFANQIGMLILDEPTAGLDTRHVELLEAVLTSLGSVVRSQGAQVFIITHEQRLRHVFDQVVELERSIL